MAAKNNQNKYFNIGIFLLAVLLIVFGVYHFFSVEKKRITEQKKQELKSIASLKINEISSWYTNEIIDAGIISKSKFLVGNVEPWVLSPTLTNKNDLYEILEQATTEHGFKSITILSNNLEHFISSDKKLEHIDSSIIILSKSVLISKSTLSSDLFKCHPEGKIYIDFIAPIFNSKQEPVAAAIFQHDPELFLFPYIQSWPIPSKTSETLILRREDDSIIFLNNLRHVENSALNLTIPISKKYVPAVYSALGNVGFIDGYDYRKKRVLAYTDSIPGTHWFFVAKVDHDELFNSQVFKAYSPILVSVILVFLILMLFYLFYIYQQRNSFKKLYQSNQEFRTTLYSIGDAVITTDKLGRVQYLNPVAEKLTGWSESEASKRSIEEVFVIINEENRKVLVNPVKLVIEKGIIIGLANHTLLVSKNGDEIPIADSGAPIFDESGNISGVVLVFRDQTYERKSQNEIIETQRELATLLSNLPGMAYRCNNDANWTMEFVSRGCELLTGYNSKELENNNVISYSQIIHPDDKQSVWDIVQYDINKHSFFQIEYRIITKNGDTKWVWEKGQGIFNLENDLIAIEGFIIDITDRKKAEIALYQSEDIFNQFMKFSPIFVFFKDENIRSLKLSQNYEQMLGRPLNELIGKNMNDLFPSDFAKKMVSDDKLILQKGEELVIEEEFNGRNYLTFKFPVKIEGKPNCLAGFTIDITERKNIEEALRASEHLFQTLAENATVGIFRTDSLGMTTYVNPMWCLLVGLELQHAINDDWLEFVHPDDRQALLDGWKKAFSNKSVSKAEYRFIHPDGKIVYVKGQAVPEFNDRGEFMGYIGTLSDITDSIMTSEKLINANKLLRTFIDNIPDAVYMKDIEGRKVIANKADVENCGFNSEEELIGKHDFDMFPKEIAAKFWEDDKKVLQTGIPVLQREEKLVNLKNKTKWLITSKIPFKDKNGEIIGLIGIGNDITIRKRNEDEMLKLTKAITQSPVSIVITNLAGDIEYINPKFSEVTGYSYEEVIGKNPRILNSGSQPKEFYTEMWSTILAGNDWKAEFHNKKKNGELFWENVIISPILNDDNEIIYFVAVKEDITEKKKMIEELIAAKIKAEESDKLKSSFLANMSHEIRTPLNSILGFSNFLTNEDDLTNQEKREFSGIINKSAEGLLQIINDIIDISSLETGQLKTFYTNLKVNSILKSIHTVFSLKLVEINKSHLFLILLEMEDITVYADENRFIQIVTNLLSNAIKFTSRGEISFGVENIDDDKVTFIVTDTGIGIKPEMQVSIFERFRQGEENTTRTYGGNGLGLSIVKNLVELMGGNIWLESEIDKGSKFRFTLPRIPNSK